MNEKELKELICDIGKRIYTNGFVAANDGNITVKLRQRVSDDADGHQQGISYARDDRQGK